MQMRQNDIQKAFLLFIVCLSAFSCKVKVNGEFPKYTDYEMPSPAPAAPGEPFAPEMAGSAKENTPACAEWTQTAGPDESLILTGENFTSYKRADEGKDSRFKIVSSGGIVKDASIQRLERNKAVITIDKEIPKWSMYLIWPGNKEGYGKPIAVNKTDAWWLGPARATRGSTISVYGRNLSHFNDSVSSNVYIKPARGKGIWAKVTKVNPYKVDFIVPYELSTGEYEVWTHNGHGAKYGWSGPLKLDITPPTQWIENNFNVKDYGALGDGQADDTDAIYRTLAAAAKSTGSTVYFPRGTYMISRMLNPADNTRWKGDGQNQTFIKCNSSFNAKSDAMIYGAVNTFQISDLAFDTNNNYRAIQPSPFFLRGSSNVRLHKVTFSFQNYNVLQLDNTKEVFVSNCKMIGKISFLGNASQLFIDSCDFYLTNDTENALHSWGGNGISLTNSTCRDYDNKDINNGAGWGKGRFFHAAGNAGSTRHTYLGNNRTYDLAVRPVGTDQNSGEQFLWEGFSAEWAGAVSSSSGSKTSLRQFSKTLSPGMFVAVIIKGRGMGQSRWIRSDRGTDILLERPWNLPPDKTSIIVIGHFADKIVMYKNSIDGKAEAVKRASENASSGIQPYGGVLNFIADGNIITDVRAGISNWSTQHTTGIDPNYFNLFVKNTINNSRWGIMNALLELKRAETGLMGAVYRKNTIHSALESGIAIWLSPVSTPVMDNFLYEHNTFLNVSRGFYLRNKAANNITDQTFYKNSFSAGAKNPAITLTNNNKFRGNTYIGFPLAYSGTLFTNAIAAPVHVIELPPVGKGTFSTMPFTLWNSGALKLNFKLKTDVKWLYLSESAGSISDERASNRILLRADPAGLPAGVHRAQLSVISGNQIRKYTVLFNVVDELIKKVKKD